MYRLNDPEVVSAEINSTLALLNTEFNLDKVLRKNIVLFIGITGSGKSTACQFLAGNPNLRAMEEANTGNFYITDGDDKVSESTTKSKTLLPELVPIPNTNTVLADCPGFSDTRSVSHDIAATVFTKKLLDESERVKIMVTTSYHSVQRGIDRTGFTKLLEHLVHFIKDIGKYENSIGLLVTKVDNRAEVTEFGSLRFVPDNRIIEGFGLFLETVKTELLKKAPNEIVSKQIQLVNIFITKNSNNEYSKIGIFRRPTTVKSLYSDERMTKNKDDIHHIINNSLQSCQTATDDFGLSLSVESMYILHKIRDTITIKLSQILDEYNRVYSQQELNSVADNLESIKTAITRSNMIVDLLQSEDTPKMRVTQLLERIHTLNPAHPAKQYTDWKHQMGYLHFLESISPTKMEYDDFSRYQIQFGNLKSKISNNVNVMGQKAEKLLDQAINETINEVMNAVKKDTVSLEISPQWSYQKLLKQIEDIYNSAHQFQTSVQTKHNLRYSEFMSDFKANFNVSSSHEQKLESYLTEIDFLKSNVTATLTDGHQEKWLQGFLGPMDAVKTEAEWYAFIVESYKKLMDYRNQSIVANNMADLKNWTKFKTIRKQLGTDAKMNKLMASRPNLTSKEQIDLNNLIDSLQTSTDFSCESSKLMVKGTVVELSKVKLDYLPKCPTFMELYIFSTQTVVIDESLVEPGKNVYIFAPIWKIVGTQTINLRGNNARVIDKERKSGAIQEMAGDPGHSGGNFIGLGDKFVNGSDLTIDVSGGKGGNGVNGESGRNGKDGENPSKRYTKRVLAAFLVEDSRYTFDIPNLKFSVSGEDGEPGVPGGDGGQPGFGGKPGNITVSSAEIIKHSNVGKSGRGGRGGQGGNGGKHGDRIGFKHVDIYCTFVACPSDMHVEFEENRGHAPKGANGVSGVAGTPAEPQQIPFVPLDKVKDEYNDYIRQNQHPLFEPLKAINRRRRSANTIHSTPMMTDNLNRSPLILAIDGKSGKLEHKSWNSQFSLSSFIALADVLIRKLAKSKPMQFQPQDDPDWENLLVQAEVLNIVDRCEAKLNEVNQNIEPLFDPVCLQKELSKRLRQFADESEMPHIEADIMEKMLLSASD